MGILLLPGKPYLLNTVPTHESHRDHMSTYEHVCTEYTHSYTLLQILNMVEHFIPLIHTQKRQEGKVPGRHT